MSMGQRSETIAAIATPLGVGGIGIIRLSGPQAQDILKQRFVPAVSSFHGFQPRMMHRGTVLDSQGQKLDDVLVVFMPKPHSFTGEDVVEWHCHGNPLLLEAVLESLIEAGARLAERGEFTRRAFLNDCIDLTQAEAVAEVIAAPSREGIKLASARLNGLLGQRIQELREKLESLRAKLCLAVDFPEEETECLSKEDLLSSVHAVQKSVERLLESFERTRCWREGVTVALAGPVNAGKSSLMNALLGRERAIVTENPGTTRDFLEETARLDGLPVRLVDTAGLRTKKNLDPAEIKGIQLGQEKTAEADLVFLLFDGEKAGLNPTDLPALAQDLATKVSGDRVILIWNKSDLLAPPSDWAEKWQNIWMKATDQNIPPLTAAVSARTGEGLDELAKLGRKVIEHQNNREEATDLVTPNLRQSLILRSVQQDMIDLATEASQGLPYDLCAVHLESAVASLAEITGLDTPEDVLNKIFATFCIGK